MAGYNQLERLEFIIYLLQQHNFITKQGLIDRFRESKDMEVTERTLERDLKALKENYSLDISYNHQHRGYELADDEQLLSRFFKFAELSSLAKIYEEGLKNYSHFEKWIIPDDSSELKGVHHINTIVKAMNNGFKLKFKKENFHSGEVKEYTVTPLRLKEYLNRWYLIAIKDGEDIFKNYGIERISDLEIVREQGIDTKKFEKKLKRYKDIVGINYSDEYFSKPVKVVCHTYDNQHKYLETLPLHHSQKVVHLPDKEEAMVTFYLQPNYEFISDLLRMNDNIVVEEPEALRDIMIWKHENALSCYR
ncbi:helix-turn-helix transcriptional regulator [Nonlabens antarcticus]|uniref:helix-turn-helix transcriptional regulator n=1 Tax=Nonlabens antarcticus TaxID=392714 RepID=UPI001890F9BD|nr:WYL domain-containing protein [Nonlabens antarcticus]